MTTYLITCAGSKQMPLTYNPSNLNQLSYDNLLYKFRKEIIELSGIELDWNKTLPAWQLYSGRRSQLYSQISKENWKKPCIKIKILSALFGWIDHRDLIPIYDLKMTDKLTKTNNQTVWRFWKEKKILNQAFNLNNSIDLLSTNYRKAINGKDQQISLEPQIKFTDYGIQKGKWLNKALDNINCI
jgi:cytoplasmic iron level regulating protein YaaA (DUF328/UPF0246 family)